MSKILFCSLWTLGIEWCEIMFVRLSCRMNFIHLSRLCCPRFVPSPTHGLTFRPGKGSTSKNMRRGWPKKKKELSKMNCWGRKQRWDEQIESWLMKILKIFLVQVAKILLNKRILIICSYIGMFTAYRHIIHIPKSWWLKLHMSTSFSSWFLILFGHYNHILWWKCQSSLSSLLLPGKK